MTRFDALFEENRRFCEVLPGLLDGPLVGRWVVFKEGEVRGDFQTAEEAYTSARSQFGLDQVLVVQVAPQTKTPMTIGLSFGL